MRTLSDKEVQTLVCDFYTGSHEDIVGLSAIAQAVEDLIDNVDAAREQALRVAKGLLAKGMLAGDSLYHASGYRPWPDQERTAVMHRIRREWMELGHSPSIPDIVLFGPPKQSGRSAKPCRIVSSLLRHGYRRRQQPAHCGPKPYPRPQPRRAPHRQRLRSGQ